MFHRHVVPLLAFAFLLCAYASLAFAQPAPITIATGLNAPMGLHVDEGGTLFVVEAGMGGEDTLRMMAPGAAEPQELPFGPTSRLLRLDAGGSGAIDVVAAFPSVHMGMDVSGASRVVTHDGDFYVTSGAWIDTDGAAPPDWIGQVVRVDGVTGALSTVSDTWALEEAENPDGFILESHPYGLAFGPDGMLYVADAGANTLLRIDPAGGAPEVVAVFDGVPGFVPNAARGGVVENDPVPTAVAFGTDGETYVSFLPGFPPAPGSGRVVRVHEDGSSVAYADGTVLLTDLQAGPDGRLYAVRMADFGEQGPAPMTGALLRIEEGSVTEVANGLSFPTALAFDADGNAFVTLNGVGAPGSGEVIRLDGVAAEN
ncbi:MAG: ScyD/ScyE family protein [Trueperaceae bacterium]